jgi:type VI secretion system protein ImpF
MAELTHKERLQPSLLDRITDDAPDKQQEPRSRRVLGLEQLRESVRRDLRWLLNTTNLVSLVREAADYPLVAGSVLNYGVSSLAGRTVSGVDTRAMERVLLDAIRDFEPRLLRNSVRVQVSVEDEEMSHNTMTFLIEAALWAQPIPLRLFLRTSVDLETGHVEVNERQE